MARLWSRKQNEPTEPAPAAADVGETVRLDDEDHAWWAQADVAEAWTPGRSRPRADDERDILAEHFGEDWRTSFLYTPPTEAELAEERRLEQQRLDDQDPYKVLQVSQGATWDEIVAAHRHQARVHHPDLLVGQTEEERAKGEDRIRVINQAYQELRVRRGV
jgi:DnaJ domain